MSDVAGNSAAVQIESLTFRAPVSESALQSIGALTNWLFSNTRKTTINVTVHNSIGSGTFTPQPWTKSLWIVMIGGGGGGGGCGTLGYGGGGGGGGGFLVANISSVSGTYSWATGGAGTTGSGNTNGGDGGDTTFFTSTYVAHGGKGGAGTDGSGAVAGGLGGSTTANGVVYSDGGKGENGALTNQLGALGGSSVFGNGGPGRYNGTASDSAVAFGAGGGGAGGGGSNTSGGSGKVGFLAIIELG